MDGIHYLVDCQNNVVLVLVKHDDGHVTQAKLANPVQFTDVSFDITTLLETRKKRTPVCTCRTDSPAARYPSPPPAP